ncbi:hypothetical protein O181_002067 [Austropuccinia psidii MF-1]|uniref:Uncharacterized protein n=1 Tax=Austropuccinia psidii MF-1 TaxID=1389203 RepID=A0A9Q3BBS3_9BASI|nr:hypothetical protein [Austropuccinia psidii MF-1]
MITAHLLLLSLFTLALSDPHLPVRSSGPRVRRHLVLRGLDSEPHLPKCLEATGAACLNALTPGAISLIADQQHTTIASLADGEDGSLSSRSSVPFMPDQELVPSPIMDAINETPLSSEMSLPLVKRLTGDSPLSLIPSSFEQILTVPEASMNLPPTAQKESASILPKSSGFLASRSSVPSPANEISNPNVSNAQKKVEHIALAENEPHRILKEDVPLTLGKRLAGPPSVPIMSSFEKEVGKIPSAVNLSSLNARSTSPEHMDNILAISSTTNRNVNDTESTVLHLSSSTISPPISSMSLGIATLEKLKPRSVNQTDDMAPNNTTADTLALISSSPLNKRFIDVSSSAKMSSTTLKLMANANAKILSRSINQTGNMAPNDMTGYPSNLTSSFPLSKRFIGIPSSAKISTASHELVAIAASRISSRSVNQTDDMAFDNMTGDPSTLNNSLPLTTSNISSRSIGQTDAIAPSNVTDGLSTPNNSLPLNKRLINVSSAPKMSVKPDQPISDLPRLSGLDKQIHVIVSQPSTTDRKLHRKLRESRRI